ncbi:tyrosine-type recombinase/integrase [Jeotgalibaca porci]|uniref:tyrosine-type recombinase/integrase n=1 Tax=Jeotgalibaca porci TaxID=1868793 RepID=UPI00359F8DFE
MWIEDLDNGKFKFVERYKDPMTNKTKKVSITLTSKSSRAEKKAQRLLDEKINSIIKNKHETDLIYSELAESFWEQYPKTVKNSTSVRAFHNQNIINRYIDRDTLVNKMDAIYIQSVIDKIYYDEKYSQSTVKQIKSLISMQFRFGKKKEMFKYNPALDIEIKRKPDAPPIRHNNFIDTKRIPEVIEWLNKNHRNQRYADLIEFLFFTGCRVGEALALQENNLNGNVLTISGTLSAVGREKGTTKNNKVRSFTIPQSVVDILRRVKIENEYYKSTNEYYSNSNNYFFVSSSGNSMQIPNTNTLLGKCGDALGLCFSFSTHVCRHTHISLLAELGVSLPEIMQRVGHSKPEVTLSIYSHVTSTMQQKTIEKLDAFNAPYVPLP